MHKPAVFIGSSKEGIEIGRAVQTHLEEISEVTVWDQGLFTLGQSTMETLIKILDRFDFAILILTPDDMVISRDLNASAPRDNVLFELGMFIGRLGRERTFIMFDKTSNLKFPTDLSGITVAPFITNREDGNLIAAVGSACTFIRNSIRVLHDRPKNLAEKGDILVDIKILKGPHQILESVLLGLKSVDLEKAVVYRVLPSEFDTFLFGADRGLVDEYSNIIQQLIRKGLSDIGYWDKTIFGRALNKQARQKTSEFIKLCYMPCPDTSYLGVDETNNQIGIIMIGESSTGFPSDFLWKNAVIYFGDPESSHGTPIYGFATRSNDFIESFLHQWWMALQKTCERKGQYWDARNYQDSPREWEGIIDTMTNLIDHKI